MTWKAIIAGLIAALFDAWRKWRDFKRIEETKDAQAENDTRDRGTAADVARRLRQRAERDGI
jgi:predicted histidine transporter YuiF (NhaC family)